MREKEYESFFELLAEPRPLGFSIVFNAFNQDF